MQKSVEDIAVGDWVLGPTIMLDRFVGPATLVREVKPKTVTGDSYMPNPLIDHESVEHNRTLRRSSILYVFTTKEEAVAVSVKSRELGEQMHEKVRQLKQAHKQEFEQFVATFADRAPA